MALSILLISVPNLVFALLLQQVFAGKLGWFPVIGWPSDHLWTSGWSYTVLPTLAGCFGYIASYARLLKASMLDVMNQDYILTAESKGLTHRGGHPAPRPAQLLHPHRDQPPHERGHVHHRLVFH